MSQANGNQAANSSPVIVPSAQANQEISVPAVAGAEVQFQFDPTTASVERVDNNLVLTLDTGGKVTITDFFVTDGQPLPMLALPDGQVVPSEAVLAGLNGDMDLSTAAGPAARPPSSGGTSYEDGAGDLIDGTDRLGSLGTDFWGNTLGQREEDIGTIETPGGTFDFGVISGGFEISGGLYEDGQAFQHDNDPNNDQVVAGKLNFTFTGTGTTEVESVSLTGFPVGTVIYIGDPANPSQVITIETAGQAVSLAYDQLAGEGVYLLPPPNSDADMNINASVTLRAASSGVTETLNGSFIVVVDAVADKPADVNTSGVDYAFGGQAGFGAATKGSVISFDVTAKFNDTDGSEDHFVLVEKQEGLTLCDASGAPVVYETVDHDGTTYYKLPVSSTTSPVTEKVYFTPDKDAVGTDDTYKLKTGALAHERADTDAELTLDNNTAITINESTVSINVDYMNAGSVSSKENAYEDNNDQQNIGGAANAAITENGEMTISLNNLGADTNTVIQGDITITFEYPAGQTPGDFYQGDTKLTLSDLGGGKWSVAVPAANSTSQTVRYEAPANADADLTNVKYGMTLENKTTGETKTVTEQLGDGHLVVDAVADKPTDLGTGAVSYSLNGTGHAAATTGSIISFDVTAKFNDTDGSEKHFVLVEKQGGLTLCDADGNPVTNYETVVEGGTTYYKLPVSGTTSPVTESVYFTPDKSAVATDKTYSLKTGAMAEEQATAGELTTDNNTAVTINNGAVSINVDYMNAGNTASENSTYEDGDANQHKGTYIVTTGNEGQITVGLSGATLDTSSVINGEITITFSYKTGETPGDFYHGGTKLTLTDLDNGNWSVKVPADGTTSQTITYKAPANSDADLTEMEYSAQWENKATGEVKSVENVPLGDGRLVVDAVADKPGVEVATDGSQVVYSNDHGKGQAAAKPGESVTLKSTVTFNDLDGSEEHFVLIEVEKGVTYEGYSLNGKDGSFASMTPVPINGGSYYRIPVDGKTASFEVAVTVKAFPTQDTPYDIAIGGQAKEVGTSGAELDTRNNESVHTENVTFQVAPSQAVVKITTVGTYEGNNANQNGGNITPATDAGAVRITLANNNNDNDYMGRVYLKYDSSEGSLVCNGVKIPSGTMLEFNAQGNCTTPGFIGVTTAALGNGSLKYVPDAGSDSDKDVNIEFAASVIDPDSGDTSVTTNINGWDNTSGLGKDLLNGVEDTSIAVNTSPAAGSNSSVVVDAVADKVTTSFVDADKNGKVDAEYIGKDEAAQPTEHVLLKNISIQFGDYDAKDGSEKHFLMVQKIDTNTIQAGVQASNLPDQTITMKGDNGQTLEMVIVGGKIASITVNGESNPDLYKSYIGQSISEHSVNGSTGSNSSLTDSNSYNSGNTNNNGDYFKIPVPNEFLQSTGGKITTDVIIGVPNGQSIDENLTLKVGGMGVESSTSGSEITTNNNASYDFKNADIKIGVVTSAPKIVINTTDSKVYENDTPNAHKGDETTQGPAAKITVGGIDAGETATITLYFTPKGNPADVSFKDIADDEFMDVYNSKGEMVGTAAWDNTIGKWSVTLTVAGKGSGADTDETFSLRPGNNYNSWDIDVDYKITVKDNASGQVGKNVNGVMVGDDNNPWQNTESGKTGYQSENKDMGIQVDAVAQAPVLVEPGKADYAATGGQNAFTSTGKVVLQTKVTFQDIADGSEKHYLLVEAKGGWSQPESVTFTAADGKEYTMSGSDLSISWQKYDGNMYYRIEIPNDKIPADDTVNARITMQSPGTGDTSFKTGAMAYEDADKINNSTNVDFDPRKGGASNNISIVINKDEAKVHFDDATKAGVAVGDTYEDLNSSQHRGTVTKENPGSIVFTSNNSAGGDDEVLTKVTISYDNPEGTVALPGGITIGSNGAIYPNGLNMVTSGTITTITGADGSKFAIEQSGGKTTITVTPGTNNTKVEVQYTPDANSDEDFNFSYKADTRDPSSGDTASKSGNGTVVVDAVADQPDNVDISGGEGTNGGQFVMDHKVKIPTDGSDAQRQMITITAKADFNSDIRDGSENHFILIEVTANTYVLDAQGNPMINCPIFYGPGGVRYFKVPVPNEDIADDGTVTKEIKLITYSRMLGHKADGNNTNIENIRTGTLAEESNTSGGELTKDNNTAFKEGESFTITHKWPGGHTIWINPAYENNTPWANEDDKTQPGMQPNEKADLGGKMYFGTVVEDGPAVSEAKLDWETAAGKIVVRDGSGNIVKEFTSGTATLTGDDLKNAYFVPNKNYDDNDVNMKYTLKDSNGQSTGGTFPIIIDAVAQLPEPTDYDPNTVGWQSGVDYGNSQPDGSGYSYTAMGAKDGSGNEGAATVRVGGTFKDTDGSEKHYALLENNGKFSVVEPAVVKEVYLYDTDGVGKSWLMIEIPKGQSYVDIKISLNEPTSGKHEIRTGVMSEETNNGVPGDYEVDAKNNFAYDLTGKTIVEVSTVDSSLSTNMTGFDGNEVTTDERFPVTVNLTLGVADKLDYFDISCPAGKGTLYYNGQPVTGNLRITDPSQLKNITFRPNEYSDEDTSINWSGKITDSKSGDSKTIGGTINIPIDAVAQTPLVADAHFGAQDVNGVVQDGRTATVSGGKSVVTATVTFEDIDDGSEKHYIVLEQDGVWTCQSVIINGVTYDATTSPKLTTMFSDDGTPFYALEVSKDMLNELGGSKGSADVQFHLTAPDRTSDHSSELRVGGISVEETTGVSGSKGGSEATMTNNWAEGLGKVTAGMAMVETKAITLGNTGTLIEDSDQGTTLSLSGMYQADNNKDGANDEIVTKTAFTVTQSGTAAGALIGHIIYGDLAPIPVYANTPVTLPYGADGFKAGKDFRFVLDANNHNNNAVTIKGTSTVVDTQSGDERTFDHSNNVTVQATADAPTDVAVTNPVYTGTTADGATATGVGASTQVTFSVSAKFADIDGSEQHFILVEAKAGWGNPKGYSTVTTGEGTFYKVPVTNSKDGNPTVNVTLTTPANATDSSVSLKVGGMAVENSNNNTNYTFEPNDNATVNIGVVSATGVTAGNVTMVEDSGTAPITLSIMGGVNESIVKVVITNPPTNMGTILYNGDPVQVVNGKMTITDANFDPNKLEFQPNANWAGTYTPSYTTTVQDNASGLQKTFSGSMTITVAAEADAPTTDSLVNPGDAENQAGHMAKVSFTLAADFADNDGSEEHFFLVTLPAGATPPAEWEDLQVSDSTLLGKADLGGTVYKIPADADGNASFDVTVPQNFNGGDLKFKAGAVEIGQNPPQYELSEETGTGTIKATEGINYAPEVQEAGGVLDGTETSLSGELKDYVTDRDGDSWQVASASFGNDAPQNVTENEPLIIQGDYGTLTLHADGTYQYDLHQGVDPNTINGMESFAYTVRDSEGGENASSINITLGNPEVAHGDMTMAPSAAFAPMAEHFDDALAAQALHDSASQNSTADTAGNQDEWLITPSGEDTLLNDCAGEHLLLGQPQLAEDGTYVHGFVYEGAEPLHIELTDENNQVLSLRDVLFTEEENALDTYLEAMVSTNEITLIVQAGNMEHTITIEMGAGAVAGYESYNSFVEQYNTAESEEAQSAMVHQLLTSITC